MTTSRIAIVDNCGDCPHFRQITQVYWECRKTGREILTADYVYKYKPFPDWCPLAEVECGDNPGITDGDEM